MPRGTTLLIAACVTLAACTQHEHSHDHGHDHSPLDQDEGAVLATYEGGAFTAGEFKAIAERMNERTLRTLNDPDMKRQFVEAQAMNDLLFRRGQELGYDHDPDIVRQVAELRRSLVMQRVMEDLREPDPVTDEEIRALYEANKRLYSGGQVRARHILVKDEALAEKLRAEVLEDPDRFPELAKEHSTDNSSKARGGDLGFFGQGRMVAAFERAAFALEEVGDVSEVVKTPFGYHVIMLTDSRTGTIKSFDEVKDRIRVGVLSQRRQEVLAERLTEIKDGANLELIDDAIAAQPVPERKPGLPKMGGH